MKKGQELKRIKCLLHQVIHECLQRNIIGEDGLRRHPTAISTSGVCSRWVQLRQKETGLRTASIADNETGQRESIGDKFLRRNR